MKRKSNCSKWTLESFWVFILFRFEIDFIPIRKKGKSVLKLASLWISNLKISIDHKVTKI